MAFHLFKLADSCSIEALMYIKCNTAVTTPQVNVFQAGMHVSDSIYNNTGEGQG